MKALIKKLIPAGLLSFYHYLFALFANLVFGIPSRKMIIIGITGTKGKTSAANFIWSVLQAGDIKTGIISTANIRIGEINEENNFHMTMPGRFFIQKTLSRMVKAGCEAAIVETTSQGILQHRHVGVRYDVGIFTNLTPEHIDAHGSFEKYKETKGEMFKVLSNYGHKKWRGKEFLKTIVANVDDESSPYYLNFKADQRKKYSIEKDSDFKAQHIKPNDQGASFEVLHQTYETKVPGQFNIYNALPAIVIGELLGVPAKKIKEGLKAVTSIRGRMDEIQNHKGFRVFVDYAHEPAGLQSVIETANGLKGQGSKSIVLVGAAGGGRDKARRTIMGSTAGKYADIVVVSDDEPYEENPVEILNAVKAGALEASKIENQNLFVIGDRREGIRKTLTVAKPGDIVIYTGLGHQNVRMIGREAVPWTDKGVAEEELKRLN